MSIVYKRIVISTDLSPASLGAFAHAGMLARQFNAALTALVVYPTKASEKGVSFPGHAVIAASGLEVSDPSKIEEKLKRLVAEQLPDQSVACKTLGSNQGIAQSIVEFCREDSTDLLVLSTTGKTGLRRAVLGSVAESVARTASCPVLLIRGQA